MTKKAKTKSHARTRWWQEQKGGGMLMELFLKVFEYHKMLTGEIAVFISDSPEFKTYPVTHSHSFTLGEQHLRPP